MIDEGLFSVLTADASVSALVGARVYALGLPQNPQYPCISYSVDEQEESSGYDGQGDFGAVDIQLDSWADDYQTAKDLAAAVKARLKNYQGELGGVRVFRLILSGSVIVKEEAIDKYRASQVFNLLR